VYNRPKTALRHELKFLVNRAQQAALLERLSTTLQPDSHGDADGAYRVTSLYYDTPDYKAYWDKVDGFNFRRKVRVRFYGEEEITPASDVFLEIKARHGTRMGKRRLIVPYATAVHFADTADDSLPGNQTTARTRATAQELHYLFSALQLQPACVVSYQRLAYGSHPDHPDLRVTFDTDVRGRIDNLSLLSADGGTTTTVLDPGLAILEVKVNQTIPFWLGALLSQQRCTPRRISKYCATLERCQAIRRRQHILAAPQSRSTTS